MKLKTFIKARTLEQMDYDPNFPIHFLIEKYGNLRYHPPAISTPYPTYRERFFNGSEPGYLIGEHIVDQLSGYFLTKINAVKVDYKNHPLNLKMYTGNLRRNQTVQRKNETKHSWRYDIEIGPKEINNDVAYLLVASDWILGRLRFFYHPTDYVAPRGGKGRSFILHREINDLDKTPENRQLMIDKIKNKGHVLLPYEYNSLEEIVELVKASTARPRQSLA